MTIMSIITSIITSIIMSMNAMSATIITIITMREV